MSALVSLCLSALLAVTGVATPVQGKQAEDPAVLAARHAFVELAAEPATAVPGQGITLVVRIGVEAGFLDRQLVQPFPRRLDLPVRVEVPWEILPEGLRALHGRVETGGGPSLVVGEELARARPLPGPLLRDGRSYRVFELRGRIAARAAGSFKLPPVRLHLAFATRFERDVLGDRVPVDRKDVVLSSPELRLEVRPLPEAGKPADFGGVVGDCRLSAEATPTRLVLGDSTRLRLTLEGDGDLTDLSAPVLEPLRAFHIAGRIEAVEPGLRRWTWTLVPRRSDVTSIPSLGLSCFVPGEGGGYRRLETEAIPLEVRPGPDGATTLPGLPPPVESGPDKAPGPAAEPAPGPSAVASGPPASLGDGAAAARVLTRLQLLWDEQRFDEARALLEAGLADPALDRAAVLTALGRVAIRLERPAEAIWHWLRALRLRPEDPVLAEDLRLARTRLGLGPVPGPGPLVLLREGMRAVPGAAAACTVLVLLALVVLVHGRRRLRGPALGTALVALAALALWALGPVPTTRGVVLSPRLQVRPEPHAALAGRFELKAGQLFEVREASDRWVHLRHGRGEGWVERDRVALCED